MQLILWRWRPWLTKQGLLDGLVKVIEEADMGVLQEARRMDHDDDYEREYVEVHEYPWSVQEVSIRLKRRCRIH